MSKDLVPTRAAALVHLKEFLPRATTIYAQKRNFDLGPEHRDNVSRLSAYLSHRILTEREVVEAVLEQHKPRESEAFLQELCWRTYWKGWLEGRPQLYQAWIRLLAEDRRRWPEREDYQKTVAGETGLEAFDHWVKELKETGYLHHQARTWFASIWIFTWKLPWSLGAEFFMRHLLDGDVASNTLNWRSIAGLQTRGKHHVATARAIEKYTKGRFNPTGKLALSPAPLSGPGNPPYLPPVDFPFTVSDKVGEDYALFLTPDDLAPEVGSISGMKPALVIALGADEGAIPWSPSAQVFEFQTGALRDARERAETHFGCPSVELKLGEDPAASLQELMKDRGLNSLVYYEPFVGPWKEPVARMSSRDVGVKFFPLRRSWDGLLFPHAVKSYLHFKKFALPQIVRSRRLTRT